MKSAESEKALKMRLNRPLESLTARSALGAMFAFYTEQSADDVALDEDGDMLVYEWGVYSFTGPETFQLSITRQFITTDDDEPYQLRLTLHFTPRIAV